MVKTKKLWVVGLLIFSLVLLIDFVQFYLFMNESMRRNHSCVETKLEANEPIDQCKNISAVAESAYTRATATHVVIGFSFFALFLILAARIAKAEERISELEENGDA